MNPSRNSRLGLISLVLLGSVLNRSPAQDSSTKSHPAPPIAAVFNVERSRTADVLTLDSGEKLTGKLINANITLRTAWGSAKIETYWLAGIDIPEGLNGLASVVTVNNHQLTGFIEDPTLHFEPAGRTVSDIRREKLRRILFAIRADEPKRCTPDFGLQLRNGVSTSGGNGDASSHVGVDPGGRVIEGMVWIAPGEFMMGSPTDEPGRDIDEGPQTKVVLPHGFWMAQREVTQAEYRSVMGANPSINPENSRLPVEKISWFEAMDYCAQLTRQAEAAGRLPKGCVYRLPTEAEWEYACRAGTTTRFSYGDDKTYSQLGDYAWFVRNGESTAHPVGTRRPNPWGLFDMHGNVWEWCLDRWTGALPGGTITNNPVAAEGTLRVARGGSWLYEAKACRSANRDDYSPSNRCGDVGFRVVLSPVRP